MNTFQVVKNIVDKIVCPVNGIEITPESKFIEDLGADELDCVEIIMEVEKGFNISMPDEVCEKLLTVKQLCDVVEKTLRTEHKIMDLIDQQDKIKIIEKEEIKYGGGHYTCEKCGIVHYGSTIHYCDLVLIDGKLLGKFLGNKPENPIATEYKDILNQGSNILKNSTELFSKDWCRWLISILKTSKGLVYKRHFSWEGENDIIIEQLQEVVDGKIIQTPESQRLVEEWRGYGKIIIAFGFDDTVHPWRLNDQKYCDKVINLIKDCVLVGAYTVCNTPCNLDRHAEILAYLHNKGLYVNTINENPIELPYGNNARPVANVILDSRAGLKETMQLLENAMVIMRSYKLSQNQNFEV